MHMLTNEPSANGIVELDRRAVRASVDVVSRVAAGDLRRPTPCSEWSLGDLLAHMTAQHILYTAALPMLLAGLLVALLGRLYGTRSRASTS